MDEMRGFVSPENLTVLLDGQNMETWLRQTVGPYDQTRQNGRIALWEFWSRPGVRSEFNSALRRDDNDILKRIRRKAREHVRRQAIKMTMDEKFQREVPISNLVPEGESGEELNLGEFLGTILAEKPQPGTDYDAEKHWKRYFRLKREILHILSLDGFRSFFSGAENPFTPELDFGILEKIGMGWTYRRIAEFYGFDEPEEISKRVQKVREILWRELSDEWKKGFNGRYVRPRVADAIPPKRRQVAVPDFACAMSIDNLAAFLNSEFREELDEDIDRVKAHRIKREWQAEQAQAKPSPVKMWLNYHHSFVGDMMESYRQRRIERRMDPYAKPTLQDLRKFPALQAAARLILRHKLRNPELPEKYLRILLGVAEGRGLEAMAQEVGMNHHKDVHNVLRRAREYLANVIDVAPTVQKVHEEWILEQLADGQTEEEVYPRLFGHTSSKKDLDNFRYKTLRRIQRSWGL